MIGDREGPNPHEADADDLGPLDAMVRLNPPESSMPPAWVERYGRVVVIRHTFPGGSSPTTETVHPSEADAIRGVARAVAVLTGRNYEVVPE